MSDAYVERADLEVSQALASFLEDEALPGTGLDPTAFWAGVAGLLDELAPRNAELLEVRAALQSTIDAWHRERTGLPHDAEAQRTFLHDIGYLVPEGQPFTITTTDVDPELASVAGPQLVVPVTNARYALNAANARWGSLYDALYGTDALGDLPPPGPYDPARGERVIAWVRSFLDDVVSLTHGSHADAVAYRVEDGRLVAALPGGAAELADPSAFAGYGGDPATPSRLLLDHHGLGLLLVVDRDHAVGATDRAGIADVVLESAVTTIIDLEDSVAAVDGPDKALAYRNWLGLMRGDLTARVDKGGRVTTRHLVDDLALSAPHGAPLHRPGRSLMLVRNVGHGLSTTAVLRGGRPIPEGLLDAIVTVLCARHDLDRGPAARNSRTGSMYVVKPKMHGPDEVAFAVDTFARVEELVGVPAGTVKLGIMDEERRTSANLLECIRAASSRVVFINTGFLDRTGDEIHTAMAAGPVVRKADMRTTSWIQAYEDRNVDVGLVCGLRGRAQIGKGMWAAPDQMAAMLEQKVGHPRAGASCAWVPSPTAATLHATHYHRVDVAARQAELAAAVAADGPRASLDDLLQPPLATGGWPAEAVQEELDNNAQGILGYVVRWIDQGIGCSKVPDIHDVGLMEDRATCRISSQHIANWLLHGVVGVDQVTATMRRMAEVVDRQNAGDPEYRPMAPAYDGPAFQAACDLVLSGVEQPSGCTEPILYGRRIERKALDEAMSDGAGA